MLELAHVMSQLLVILSAAVILHARNPMLTLGEIINGAPTHIVKWRNFVTKLEKKLMVLSKTLDALCTVIEELLGNSTQFLLNREFKKHLNCIYFLMQFIKILIIMD